MPAVIEQVEQMSTAEKLRLMEYLLNSISRTVVQYDGAQAHSRRLSARSRASATSLDTAEDFIQNIARQKT